MSGARDWLVVIDLQPAFSHPHSPWFTPSLAEVAPRIAALVPHFGARVAFTRFVPPRCVSGSWRGYYERWPFALQPASDWLWALDAPWQGRESIASHTFSKWVPALRARLDPGVAIALCGVSTDCCVLMTALAAVDDGVQVRVVGDACAGSTPAAHARALELLGGRAPQLDIVTAEAERQRQERAP